MTTDNAQLIHRLAKAKTSLVLGHPFIGTIALNMPFKLDDRVPTAAVNGREVRFNPEFISNLTDPEMMFVVAHECFHPMLEHNWRRMGRDPRKWNRAADYVINQLLTDEGIGKMPAQGLLDKALYTQGNGITDNIYTLLPDEPEGDGPGPSGGPPDGGPGPLDDCQDADGTPAEQQQQQAEWKVRVAQAAQAAKMSGKLSANMARLVGEILEPRVDWRDVLRNFLTKCRHDTRSFSRLNRRFLPQGLYLPSVSGEVMGEILIAVDCSGSIGERELNEFAAEIRAIKDDLMPRCLHVMYFDSKVSHIEEYQPDDELDIQPHGGGGTAFSPVFRKADELGIEPVACVFLTDLYCDDFGDQPDYPVLWVSNAAEEAPFGQVIKM
jgi:predicted metal-dependent peptidase